MNSVETSLDQLVIAINNNNVDQVKIILNDQTRPKITNDNLKIAVEKKCHDILQLLLNAGAPIDSTDSLGLTVLNWAVMYNNVNAVQALIKAGFDVNFSEDDGTHILINGVLSKNVDIINELLQAEAKINHRNKNGETALMIANKMGSFNIVNLLIRNGANHEDIGWSLWFSVIYNEYMVLFQQLLDDKPTIDTTDKDGHSGLIIASSGNNLGLIQALLQAGANVNLVDKTGKTALMYASENGNVEIINKLLDNGADIHICHGKYTALTCALDKREIKTVVPLLLERGAGESNIDIALTTAALHGFLDITKQLIKKGANVNNDSDVSPLMAASMHGYLEIVNVLIQAGADLNKEFENTGNTALSLAIEYGHTGVVSVLIQAGAIPCNKS